MYGLEQPRNVVRTCLTWLCCYFVLAGLANSVVNGSFDDRSPEQWRGLVTNIEAFTDDPLTAMQLACGRYRSTVSNARDYYVNGFPPSGNSAANWERKK